MKKLFLVAFLFVALILTGCTQIPQVVDKITFNLKEISLKVDEEYKFTIPESVSYITENTEIIELDAENGKIKALKAGDATVTIFLKNNTSIKLTVAIKVEGDAFKITFDSDVEAIEFVDFTKVNLPTPVKQGYKFVGWYEGENLVTLTENRNYDLVAKWENEVYTITYDLDGGECNCLIPTFKSFENIELPKPTKEGLVFDGWYEGDVLVTTLQNRNYTLKAKYKEAVPEEIQVSIKNPKDVYYLDDEIIFEVKVLPEGVSQELVIRELTPTKAKLDKEDLYCEVVGSGVAKFKFSSAANSKVSTTIDLNVKDYVDPYRWLDSIQIANPIAKKARAYDSTAGYETYILGAISYIMFEDISVIQNMVPVGNGNRPGKTSNGNPFKARYVTFHGVGGAGTALATSNYCTNKGTDASWHYTTGNDGIYQQLPIDEVAYHAGDGTRDPLEFYDSGVKAPKRDDTPAKITVNQTTGYFEVNGVESKVKAPLSGDGDIVKNSELPDQTGINNYVDPETGNYMISKTWWSSTYNTLANRGGNLNSIGIESAVNRGSNLYYTWTKSAKLIGTIILPQTKLLPRDVKQHNTFSGKNCPQTMRRANMWQEFLKCIEAEYTLRMSLYDFKFELIVDSPYVNANGLLNPNNLPEVATEISYQIKMVNTKENIDKTFTYKTTIPAKSTITY